MAMIGMPAATAARNAARSNASCSRFTPYWAGWSGRPYQLGEMSAPPGSEQRVGESQPDGDLGVVGVPTRRARVHHQRLAAGGEDGVEQAARNGVGLVAQGRRGGGEAGRDGDERTARRCGIHDIHLARPPG